MGDPFDLTRFVDAQDADGVYDRALAELKAGRKQTHWMWFVFPQLRGLGASHMAQKYAIAGLPEAAAYLGDGVLGPRYRACVAALNRHEGLSAHAIMGSPDDLKLHSSLTLFALAAPNEAGVRTALRRYFDGKPDPRTLELLR
ncbi:DUF1810 domain-containing protein [Phenylobacterium sp.]|uniref:DUF1810 domain-containing protein n=1 Tax=Phenylobacterium sp. TaxID=1871053 RepID=UPI0025E8C983|nr:DUF1810 domain-containing protein [Phenylobacterium sp.]MBX3481898.1 DUF1810 domain-containing protein [Phenylobacterium sp.]MCW5758749.1 DUF1810 domain-containing protein [Phenylobacterium sp.]